MVGGDVIRDTQTQILLTYQVVLGGQLHPAVAILAVYTCDFKVSFAPTLKFGF